MVRGRREELAELRARLGGSSRLVTLTGPGGIGKSSLARAAAAEVERGFGGGVATVDVAELADASLLGTAVARALGVHLTSALSEPEPLAVAIGERQALLLLDGCDRLVADCEALVVALLARCPALVALVTSRQPLGVPGEAVLRVGPLPTPDPDGPTPPLEELARCDAVALFVERATRAAPTFRLSEDNAPAVARLCAALGGVPLALELAAARVTVLSPEGLLERLGDRYRVLTKGAPDAPAHLRSLRASVDLSHDLCSPGERLLWARASVFPGSFDLDAAEDVCSGDGVDRTDVLDLVDGLLDKSVLSREEGDPRRLRYRLGDELRVYAAERLPDDDRRRCRDRHLAWSVGLAREAAASWFGPAQAALAGRLRMEHANLGAALAHALATGRAEDALRLLVDLRFHWMGSGHLTEARRWLEQALALPGAPAALRLDAMLQACWLALFQRDADEAGRLVAEAEAEAEAAGLAGGSGTPAGPGWSLVAGALAIGEGAVEAGLERIVRGVEEARAGRDLQTQATGLLLLGMCRATVEDVEGAASALRQCVRLTERAGEVALRSYALGLVAVQALLQGEAGIADEGARQALRMKVELQDRFSIACLLEVLAGVAAAEGDGARAATLFGAADTRWRVLGASPDDLPVFGPVHRRGVARAQELLGARAYRSRCRLGADLPEDQAVRFALEDVVGEPRPEVRTPLSARELEVARLVGQGLSNREVGERLVISPRTVQGHVENILRKLGFATRTQVAAWVVSLEAGTRG